MYFARSFTHSANIIVLLWEIRGAWHSWGSTDEQKKLPQQMYNYRVRAQKKRTCS